jgi:exodeoxyribonuclease VII small subunit
MHAIANLPAFSLTEPVPLANARAMSETADPAAPEASGLSFEEALARLEAIVQQLERGDVPLEKSIDLYAEGDRLRAQCQKRLESAQARIEQIVTGPGGDATSTRGFESN